MKNPLWLAKLPIFIAAPVGAAISSITTNQISESLGNYSLIAAVFLGIFLLFASIIEGSIRYLINHSLWIRRVLLGKDFIEGWWLEDIKIVYDHGEEARGSTSTAITSIHYRSGSYVIKGHVVDKDGKIKQSWTSSFSGYDARGHLEYFFIGPSYGTNQPRTDHGYSRISFQYFDDKKPPSTYEGEVILLRPDARHVYFNAKKITLDHERLAKDESLEQFAKNILASVERTQ